MRRLALIETSLRTRLARHRACRVKEAEGTMVLEKFVEGTQGVFYKSDVLFVVFRHRDDKFDESEPEAHGSEVIRRGRIFLVLKVSVVEAASVAFSIQKSLLRFAFRVRLLQNEEEERPKANWWTWRELNPRLVRDIQHTSTSIRYTILAGCGSRVAKYHFLFYPQILATDGVGEGRAAHE